MLEPKEITISGKKYILSKFPAVEGREIVVNYTSSGIPKFGDYQINEAMMFKLMNYVAVNIPTGQLRLSTKDLVNNHVPDWEDLVTIEKEMLEYNCRFFQNGRLQVMFRGLAQRFQEWILKISTVLSEPSSTKRKRRSTS